MWLSAAPCPQGGRKGGMVHSLRATRSLALRARELRSISAADGSSGLRVRISSIGFFPHTQTGRSGGQVHRFAQELNTSLTMRSSNEW